MRARVGKIGLVGFTGILVLGCSGAALGAPTKLVFWPGWGITDAEQQWEKQIKAEFEQRHPGVELDIEHPQGDFVVSAAAGVVPDVLQAESRGPVFWRLGLLESLNPFVKTAPELQLDQFFPGAAEFGQAEGNTYGIPYYFEESGLIFDPEAFTDVGLDAGPDALPSWDAFVAAAGKLTVRNAQNQVSREGFTLNTWTAIPFLGWLASNGGAGIRDGHAAFNSAEGVDAVNLMHDLVSRYDVTSPDSGGPIGAMQNRTSAITDCSTSCMHYILERGSATNPATITSYPRGPHGAQRATMVFQGMYVVPKGSKNPELAFDLIRMLSDLNGAKTQFKYMPVLPARRDFYATADWRAYVSQHKGFGNIMSMASVAVPVPNTYIDWNGDFLAQYKQAIDGKIPAQQALNEAARLVDAKLSAFRAQVPPGTHEG